jgi:hypothetical protein
VPRSLDSGRERRWQAGRDPREGERVKSRKREIERERERESEIQKERKREK